MKSISDQILLELAALRQKTKPSNQEFHIFYKLLDYLKDEISFEHETYLVWVFTKVEKGLKEARNGSDNLAKYHLEQIIENNELNPMANFAFDFIVYPAKAFYLYNNLSSYDDAISILVKAIKSINAISEVHPEMISASIEQYLNICRVLIRKNDNVTAINEFGKLISFMLSGICETDLVPIGSKGTLNKLDELEKISMLDYVTDVSINKIIKSNDNAEKLLKALWDSINQSHYTFKDSYSISYHACFRLAIASEPASQTFNEELLEPLPNLFLLPNTLQYLFLKKIQNHFESDSRVNESIEDYINNKLNVSYLLASGSDKLHQSPLRGT